MTDLDTAWNPDKVRLGIARDLRAIELLYQGLWAEILAHADDPEIPGGDAMVMVAPAADPEAWSYRELAAALGYTESHGDYEVDTDPQPPLLVLATWSDSIRKERGQDTGLSASIDRECAYIARSVDWMLGCDADGNMNFIAIDDLVDDLRKVRWTLQRLLRIGDHQDRGAPCLTHGRRYVKVWDEIGDEPSNDLGYRWKCQGDADKVGKHFADPAEYALANEQQARRYADKLTASDMATEYRVKPGTLRKWVSDGDVHKRGKDGSGRILYDVSDTLKMRDGQVDKDAVTFEPDHYALNGEWSLSLKDGA